MAQGKIKSASTNVGYVVITEDVTNQEFMATNLTTEFAVGSSVTFDIETSKRNDKLKRAVNVQQA